MKRSLWVADAAYVLTLLGASVGCTGVEQIGSQEDTETRTSQIKIREDFVDNAYNDDDGVGPRVQVADIVDIDATHFAIGYIHSIDKNLKYAYYSSTGGQERAPFVSGGPLKWLRANTSRALNWSGCNGAVNFFTVEFDGNVWLDAHARCNGTWNEPSFIPIASPGASRSAVATKGDLNSGKALVVYGQSPKIMGRTYAFSGTGILTSESLSAPFTILDIGHPLHSIDVIYNQHSDSFIVGYTDGSSGFEYNIVLSASTSPPAVRIGARKWGGSNIFDLGSGHYTSVAYNPNGGGGYLWWRQNNSGAKAIWVHDRDGALLSFYPAFPTATNVGYVAPPCGGTNLTVPVAATVGGTHKYVFLEDCRAPGADLPRILGRTGSATTDNGSWSSIDDVSSPTGDRRQVAVRALQDETVGLVLSVGGSATGNAADRILDLVVSDQP